MGRKKPVKLSSGLEFDSVEKAKEHFKAVLNNTPLDSAVSEDARASVLVLYADYCSLRPGHSADQKAVNVYRKQNKEERPDGSHAVTTCFYVRFEDGTEESFSYIKAISAIANSSS